MNSLEKSQDVLSLKMKILKNKADTLQKKSISVSTRQSYMSDFKVFDKWCKSNNLESMPASIETVRLYLSDMSDHKTSATLLRSICAIGKVHEWSGHNNPSHDHSIKQVLSGIKRTRRDVRAKRKPITIPILKKIIDNMGNNAIDVRNRALILLGWFGALRRSEIVGISIGDVETTDEGIIITIRRSKTSIEPQRVAIPRLDDSEHENKYCPVKAFRDWHCRAIVDHNFEVNGDFSDEPLFFPLGLIGKRWFIPSATQRKPLSNRMVSKIIKSSISSIGLSAVEFSGHSLRRGLATEAGRLEVPERYIQRHLRHASIEMVREYIDQGNIWKESPVNALALHF